MITAAAPPRAAALTCGVLVAAAIRGLVQPMGDVWAAAGFVLVMGGVLLSFGMPATPHPHPALPLRGRGEAALQRGISGRGVALSLAAGVGTGLVLLLPAIGAGPSGRSLDGFWGWGAAIVVVATLEEVVIRGRLQPAWTAQAGPIAGLLGSAIVFALIHLPRYGVGAMPLDFSVGLALAGLRAVTGRVAPCAIAHVMADWGAWFWI